MNYYRGSFLDKGFDKHMKEVWGLDGFDVVVGNPPYQEMDGKGGKGSSAIPIYNLFTEKSIRLSNKILFITPSRWFIGGKGLDKFRKMMLNRKDIKIIKHFSNKIFNNVEIKGGVSYFLIDKNYNGLVKLNNNYIDKSKLDILLVNPLSYSIIDKIKNKHNGIYFNNIVESRNCFGKIINKKKSLSNGKECVDIKLNNNYYKCYVSKKEGFIKYIHKDYINNKNLDKYKDLTVKGTNVGKTGNTFLSEPNEVCTETYLVIFVNNKTEGENLIQYFKLGLIKYLFKLLNNTQNSSKSTYRLIPKIDISRKWSDQELYDFFNLTKEEIYLIETVIT
jgi:site-specific DNA-methyltransferase (adenine-specific)